MKKILLKNSELIILENWIDISSKLGIDPKTCSNAVGFISNQTSKYPLIQFSKMEKVVI